MRAAFFRIFFFLAVFAAAGCAHTVKDTLEYINPPINLTVTLVTAGTYELSFYSDNREGGFAGYGIFTGASSDAVSVYPANDLSAAAAFCANTGQINYKTTVTIQVGAAASGASLCNITSTTLVSGQYLALRGRVERVTSPWSSAAIAQIP